MGKNKHNRQNQEQKTPFMGTTPPEVHVADENKAETPVAPEAVSQEPGVPAQEEVAADAGAGEPAVEVAQAEAPAPAPVAEAKPVETPDNQGDATTRITVPKEKIMSADIIKDAAAGGTAFEARRAMALASSGHTEAGRQLINLLDNYHNRMLTPSYDKAENIARINMLYKILITACPPTPSPVSVANDTVRIMFDKFMEGWGVVYTDNNIFKLGQFLKVSPIESDRLVMFVTAFAQMIEGINFKKKVMFDTGRLRKILSNENVATAMCNLRDNINKKLGFDD